MAIIEIDSHLRSEIGNYVKLNSGKVKPSIGGLDNVSPITYILKKRIWRHLELQNGVSCYTHFI